MYTFISRTYTHSRTCTHLCKNVAGLRQMLQRVRDEGAVLALMAGRRRSAAPANVLQLSISSNSRHSFRHMPAYKNTPYITNVMPSTITGMLSRHSRANTLTPPTHHPEQHHAEEVQSIWNLLLNSDERIDSPAVRQTPRPCNYPLIRGCLSRQRRRRGEGSGQICLRVCLPC